MPNVKNPWEMDKTWADRFTPAIEDILTDTLSRRLIRVNIASIEQDRKCEADLVVTLSDGTGVLCRVRRHTCAYRDLTLRAWRSSGAKTEFAKVKEGAGRWYFYGWANQTADGFDDWIVVDLDKLRASGLLSVVTEIENHDGTTSFVSIPVTKLDLFDCIINRKAGVTAPVSKEMETLFDQPPVKDRLLEGPYSQSALQREMDALRADINRIQRKWRKTRADLTQRDKLEDRLAALTARYVRGH